MTDGNIKRSLKLTRVKTEGFKQKKTPVLLADSKGTYIENEITDPERFGIKFTFGLRFSGLQSTSIREQKGIKTSMSMYG